MRAAVALAVVALFTLTPAASAHLVTRPKADTLDARAVSQRENLAHARYVARHGNGPHVRWHREAARWLAQELAETEAAIEARRTRQLYSSSPIAAIRYVWGRHADGAIRVARCETGGTFSVYARNGQYLGLFQMGAYARARYGHSWTALGQARAAYRYFQDAGWSPWQCRPDGGLRW
ncbi:MAG TPA: hypothetical protein VM204_06945 [Gaiellaceae bacterium]|nr:hypothetical protein [Gaiellaceae bacterium]